MTMEGPALRPLPSTRRRPARPKRGLPADTRARLVAAAAAVFNRDGYHGTDTNRLARAAGYAPATFYKHFPDKRAILLAAYEHWVTAEWQAVGGVLHDRDATPAARADRIVAFVLEHHRRWKGLRASLRALVATDAVARRFHRAQRRRQLEILAGMREGRARDDAGARVDDAVMLFTLERTLDAVAEGETGDLGLDADMVLARVSAIVRAAFTPRSR